MARPVQIPLVCVLVLGGVLSAALQANDRGSLPKAAQLRIVEVKQPDGQILSYRHLGGSTDVYMRGTSLAPLARVKLKVGSRPGFVELDINRGGITGLPPAHRLGKDFLTYVLWAVSVDGRASNLGEITFAGGQPVAVNLTTPYQTFWLMVTAEPNYAVVDPSTQVVMYSVQQGATGANKALPITGDLFFYTHYSAYEAAPGDGLGGVPNQLLQARKAVELASKSGVLGRGGARGSDLKEEEYTRQALALAQGFLARAEAAFAKNPEDQSVVQFARTSAQIAENARALAMGAVGGLLVRQLTAEVEELRSEISRLRAPAPAPPPAAAIEPAQAAGGSNGQAAGPEALEPFARPSPVPALVKQPALWFAVAGWGVALVLLFRRRSI